MNMQNKTIVVVPDFFQELLAYVIKPINGSEVIPYWKQMKFNNLPPMKINAIINNCAITLMEDYSCDNKNKESNKTRYNFMDTKEIIEDQISRKGCLILKFNTKF